MCDGRGAHFLLSFSMASAADIFLSPPFFAALSPFYNSHVIPVLTRAMLEERIYHLHSPCLAAFA